MGRTTGSWALALGLLAASTGARAQAQEAPPAETTTETPAAEEEATGSDPQSAAPAQPAPGSECNCPPPQPCREQSLTSPGGPARGPMGSFGLSLKIGVAGQGKRDYRVDGQDMGRFDSRNGLLVAMAFNTGAGSGFGSDIGFVLRRFGDGESAPGAGDSVKGGTFTFEPILGGRFHLKGPGYLFVGLGPAIGLGWTDAPDAPKSGVAGFRIPVQGTVYFWKKLAAVIELGLGWDAAVTIDEDPNDPEAKVAYIHTGMTWDLSFGIRFF